MIVQAKCVLRCWDSSATKEYIPNGGPLPGGLYEIDSESQLATLTVVPVSYDDQGNAVKFYQDRDGTVKARRVPKPGYVFQFDRNANPHDVAHDYSCKKCGKVFKTLNALGSHYKDNHRDIHEAAALAEPDFDMDAPLPVKDGRKVKGKTFRCSDCGHVSPNLYRHQVHRKLHKDLAAQEQEVTVEG